MSLPRALATAFACLALAACGETFDLVEDLGVADLNVGRVNGEDCGGSTECSSAHCVDGVCCESACVGECEACNVAGQKGTCAPVPDGTDPAMECMPRPVDVDGGAGDGGTVLNLPDAGVNAMQPPCAPKCNGQRACGYPGAAVACGDTFCNTSTELGAAVCDGEGHCGVQVSDCVAYACGPKTCKTSCTANSDCLDTHFCNAGGQCQPKKSIGVTCGSNPSECQSGFCADGVCCNADCSQIPGMGGKCNNPGAVGTCQCTIPAQGVCTGTCQATYRDQDGDGYGDPTDAPTAGCYGGSPPPPTGRVTNKDDCWDSPLGVSPRANQAYPGSTYWGTAGRGSGGALDFDYNCDGSVTFEHPYRGGAVCRYCNPQSSSIIIGGPSCGGTATSSASANQYSYIYCAQSECSGSGFCFNRCCGQGCSNQGFLGYNAWAFVSGGSVCGSTGTLRWCGMGAGAGSPVPAPTDFSQTQACR